MLTRPDAPADSALRTAGQKTLGLMTVAVSAAPGAVPVAAFVASLDDAGLARIRHEVERLRAEAVEPPVVELAYVSTPASETALAGLAALERTGVTVHRRRLGGRDSAAAAALETLRQASAPGEPAARELARPTQRFAPAPDPFGLDPVFHDRWRPLLEFFADRYWRIEVDGLEHVPSSGAVVVAANHSGAVPADAAMLAATLEQRHPARRRLRVLYDRFVDQLPLIGSFYRRYGAVPASLANAEALLKSGEAVGLFPEGVHGLEKTFWDRYRLQPFHSGAARLAIRTGAPIVPAAIVGAEEAYPVVARLYRAGALVGVPWIPVTPCFPMCGFLGAVPLPTKWHIRFGAPIAPPSCSADEQSLHDLTAAVRTAIESNLEALLQKRRGWFG